LQSEILYLVFVSLIFGVHYDMHSLLSCVVQCVIQHQILSW
jgi:hypothetical protein